MYLKGKTGDIKLDFREQVLGSGTRGGQDHIGSGLVRGEHVNQPGACLRKPACPMEGAGCGTGKIQTLTSAGSGAHWITLTLKEWVGPSLESPSSLGS